MNKPSWELLARVFLFQGLQTEEIQVLCEALPEPETFAKGSRVYAPLRFRRAMGIVLSGELQVVQPGGHGGRVVMNRLLPGQVCGVAALFGECEEYVTEVLAAVDSRVLFVSQEALTRLMREDFRVAENYIRFLSGRIRFLNHKIAALTGWSVGRQAAPVSGGARESPGGSGAARQHEGAGADASYGTVQPLSESGCPFVPGNRPPGREAAGRRGYAAAESRLDIRLGGAPRRRKRSRSI